MVGWEQAFWVISVTHLRCVKVYRLGLPDAFLISTALRKHFLTTGTRLRDSGEEISSKIEVASVLSKEDELLGEVCSAVT